MENKTVVKGYKVFHSDFRCLGGFQYEVGMEYTMDGDPICSERGFHFCLDVKDCFSYYNFSPKNKIAEIEAFGKVDKDADGEYCTNGIKIVRELSWHEVLELANDGENCTGLDNPGNNNTGNRNSGDWNSGSYNTGRRNSGDCNSGNFNAGGQNTGIYNTGDYNTGDFNTGDYNTGYGNSGDYNTGCQNTGNYNTGNNNAGDYNIGDRNSGNNNTGYGNSGDYNTGDWNTGDYNTGDCNIGCFNTEGSKNSKIKMFNKPSDMTLDDWWTSEARTLITQIPRYVVKWVSLEKMTDEEKREHPEYETTGGYLKELDESDAATLWWNELPEEDKSVIKALPNFDFGIFCECLGIKAE